MSEPELWAWRHPRAHGQQGCCVGHADPQVDPRRAKRLAHRIRATARRHGLPRCVWTSDLARSRAVGRWLRRWGWSLQVDPLLRELDFGAWDGRPWEHIARAEIEAWCADFPHARPGGRGESLSAFFARVAAWAPAGPGPWLLVGHGGWLQARQRLALGLGPPALAADWAAGPRHAQGLRIGGGPRQAGPAALKSAG